jgi:FGGY-family pentulose kinase
LSAGEFVGILSKRASCELGLPQGIAVGSGIIDAYAGWVGTVGTKLQLPNTSVDGTNCGVNVAFSRLAAVAGTSTCHLAMSPDPVFVGGVWGPYRDVLIPDFWMAEGGQSATGELLKHVVESHPAFKDAIAQAGEVSIYEHLNKLLEDMAEKELAPSISHLGRNFFFYGDLWGNRSPVADSAMTGALIGLTSDRSISSLALHYYGALEFIALQTRQIVEAMNKSGHSITGIFMSGSQCQNKVLMELIATTCSMVVVIPKYVTAAVVHGAAMLGVKAASKTENGDGKLEDLWAIMERMSQPGRIVLSSNNKGERSLLDVKYLVFLDMCKTQRRYREEVDEAVKDWKCDRVVR